MSSPLPIYQIYAVTFAGPFPRPMAKVLWNTDWDKETYTNYYLCIVKGNGEIVLVDGGVTPLLAQEMKLEGYVNPVKVLMRVGIDASQIKKLIITHMNFDHINGIELFPNATFYVQEKEFNFWVKDPIAQKPPFHMMSDPVGNRHLAKLEGTERLILVNGDQQILPGMEVLLAPGHTPGLQVVAVNTAKGRAIVGSDCAHLFKNYEKKIPSCFIAHLETTCRVVLAGVRQTVPAPRLDGLLLGGGYGRGEGGVLKTAAGDQPYNDLEFYVFARGNAVLAEREFRQPLHELGETLSPHAGIEVEFKVLTLDKLARSGPSMFYYDLVAGHRWQMGDDTLLSRSDHHRDPSRIPLHEATRLLMNRCSGLLFAAERLARTTFNEADADFVGRNLAKAQLAFGDVLLTAHGKYHWSCRDGTCASVVWLPSTGCH